VGGGLAQLVYQQTTGWTAKEMGFSSQQEQEIFLFSIAARLALGPTQSSIKWVLGTISLGMKLDHSPPPIAKVENGGAIPPFSHVPSWCDD
jgi:hypothetical protein